MGYCCLHFKGGRLAIKMRQNRDRYGRIDVVRHPSANTAAHADRYRFATDFLLIIFRRLSMILHYRYLCLAFPRLPHHPSLLRVPCILCTLIVPTNHLLIHDYNDQHKIVVIPPNKPIHYNKAISVPFGQLNMI